ncbi:MAG: hypothetical protein K1Y36_28940 [Blastocatellia bacterium]|nr:hypothetical protein [Blastocatellia bacterium]
MGVPWGIVYGTSRYSTLEEIMDRWTAFCAAGLCEHFVVPFDETLYEFRRGADGQVQVSQREAPEVLAEMRALRCSDGTYDEFEAVTNSYDLYLPDSGKTRNIDRPEFKWNYQSAASLDLLCQLSRRYGRLAGELKAAGLFAKKHRMMVEVSY